MYGPKGLACFFGLTDHKQACGFYEDVLQQRAVDCQTRDLGEKIGGRGMVNLRYKS